ncbi:hypothetical protein TNCT_89841 [Trichonephila clavata]|uniref:Uncharacterized protein n=1 Tax=Trichonephila clavata TaxID=2740835 RepID=A0A8X6HH26_TRICU|nr:hypothetical protein TNCT_89841 [Trichonephila clavata]
MISMSGGTLATRRALADSVKDARAFMIKGARRSEIYVAFLAKEVKFWATSSRLPQVAKLSDVIRGEEKKW